MQFSDNVDFKEADTFINSAKRKGIKILICECNREQTNSISSLIVIYHLMKTYDLPSNLAYSFLKSQKPNAYPNLFYLNVLDIKRNESRIEVTNDELSKNEQTIIEKWSHSIDFKML